MNSPTKVVLTAFVLGIVIMGLNRLSRQDKNSIATIERQEASGRITSTQASMEKDSIARDHIFKF